MPKKFFNRQGIKLLTLWWPTFSLPWAVNASEKGEFYQVNVGQTSYTESQAAEELIHLTTAKSQQQTWKELLSFDPLPQASRENLDKIVGGEIDIRPPVLLLRFIQDLEFLEGDRLPVPEQSSKSLYIGFPNSFKIPDDRLWGQLLEALQKAKIPLSHFHPRGEAKVYTSWKNWDETIPSISSETRYAISLVKLKKKEGMRYLKIALLDSQKTYLPSEEKILVLEHGKAIINAQHPISNYQTERQIKSLANLILSEMEKSQRLSETENFLRHHEHLNVVLEHDVQNRPLFTIDAPFPFVWQIMPSLLSKCYLTANEERTKAEMSCEYLPPHKTLTPEQEAEGFRTLDLLPQTYLLQFFDLGEERTGLQWCSSKNGAVLIESDEIFQQALTELCYDYKKYLAGATNLSAPNTIEERAQESAES